MIELAKIEVERQLTKIEKMINEQKDPIPIRSLGPLGSRYGIYRGHTWYMSRLLILASQEKVSITYKSRGKRLEVYVSRVSWATIKIESPKEKIKEIAGIWAKWNAREVTSDCCMHEIMNILPDETEVAYKDLVDTKKNVLE